MEQQIKEPSDEISLYDLWKIIAKRKKLIIGLILFFVLSATITSLFMPKIYRGEAILGIPPFEILTSNISAKEISDFIGKIDSDKKAQLLPKTSFAIADIKLSTLKDSKDKIEIIIESKDISIIPDALSEIMEYINNIDIVKSNVNEEKERFLKRSSELTTVIDASSEILNTYNKLLKAGRLVPVGFNPLDLNKKIADIKVEKLMTDQVLQRLKRGVDIAKQLYIGHRPIKPKIMMNVALSCVLGIFLAILLSFFLEYTEQIKKTKGNND
jgi:hypothetical protein